MNENITTVVGNVATELKTAPLVNGVMATFRVASTTRRWNRTGWSDAGTNFFTVICFRQLAENVVASVRRGDPVIVHGRLKQREWKNDLGERGVVNEIEAYAVGHDMNRGTTEITRTRQPEPEQLEDRAKVAEALSDALLAEELAEREAAAVSSNGSREPVG